jgi:EpsI family protein
MTSRLVVLALVFFGFAAYITHASEKEVVPLREPLSEMSLEIGRWSGRNSAPFTDDILAVLGVDEYINRIYQASPSDAVSLYVGYYESQRNGDTIHSPMNCLPGAGWEPVQTSYVDIAVPDRAAPIKVKRVVIQKGIDKQVVLYWYHSHGRVIGNEYLSKIYMVYDAARLNRSDAALVRVVSPVGFRADGEAQADARAVEFVQAMFSQLDRHLPL